MTDSRAAYEAAACIVAVLAIFGLGLAVLEAILRTLDDKDPPKGTT